MDRLKRRADFLAVARGARAQAFPFLVQARERRDRDSPRIGVTVTKKTGNAVERNRIRRRLRAAAEVILPRAGRRGFDYVLVARRTALNAPYDTILQELERALAKLHVARKSGARPGSSRKTEGAGGRRRS